MENMQQTISSITVRSEKLPMLERAIVDYAVEELMNNVLFVDAHYAEFNGEFGLSPKTYENESAEEYVFRRVVIHWHIINSYWVIAIEGRGGMSEECISILKELKELANYGLEVARNLGTLEGEFDASGKLLCTNNSQLILANP